MALGAKAVGELKILRERGRGRAGKGPKSRKVEVGRPIEGGGGGKKEATRQRLGWTRGRDVCSFIRPTPPTTSSVYGRRSLQHPRRQPTRKTQIWTATSPLPSLNQLITIKPRTQRARLSLLLQLSPPPPSPASVSPSLPVSALCTASREPERLEPEKSESKEPPCPRKTSPLEGRERKEAFPSKGRFFFARPSILREAMRFSRGQI